MNPKQYPFSFGDGTVHDASVSEASEAINLCNNYGWLIVPKATGLDANPLYTIEVSDDNIVWNPYSADVIAAAIDQPFEDDHIIGTYMRINYDADTNTTGSVIFDLTLKQ